MAGTTDSRRALIEAAIQEIREQGLLPHESSVELTTELVVGNRAGESLLRVCPDSPTQNIKDIRGLSLIYPAPVEPLSILMCHDRDLACLFDVVRGELAIEATGAGEERLVIVVGNDLCKHSFLAQKESARVVFAGLAREETYMIALVALFSPQSSVEEAERIYSLKGSQWEALALLERALTFNTRLHHAWRRKAYILRGLGRQTEALSAAEESVRIDPNYALGWRCKGAILRDLGEHQLGLDCYLRSLALDPTDSLCWANKGNALLALGREGEAQEAYAEAERIGALYPEKH